MRGSGIALSGMAGTGPFPAQRACNPRHRVCPSVMADGISAGAIGCVFPLRCWLRRTKWFSDIAGASAAEPAQLTGDARAWTRITGLDKGAGRGAGEGMERGMEGWCGRLAKESLQLLCGPLAHRDENDTQKSCCNAIT